MKLINCPMNLGRRNTDMTISTLTMSSFRHMVAACGAHCHTIESAVEDFCRYRQCMESLEGSRKADQLLKKASERLSTILLHLFGEALDKMQLLLDGMLAAGHLGQGPLGGHGRRDVPAVSARRA